MIWKLTIKLVGPLCRTNKKGLIEAFNEVLSSVSHRLCVKHLHNNFKRPDFSCSSLNCALWAATSALTVKFFNVCINDIVKLNVETDVWLKEKEPTEWSKSHFLPILSVVFCWIICVNRLIVWYLMLETSQSSLCWKN